MIDWNNLAVGGAVIALWSQIRAAFERVRSLFVTKIVLDGEVANLVRAYLYQNGKIIEWGDRYIRSAPAFVRPLDCITEVAIEGTPKQNRLVWLEKTPLLFSSPADPNVGRPMDGSLIHLTYIRGTLDITALTRAALEFGRKQLSTGNRYRVHRVLGRSRFDIQNASIATGMNQAFPTSVTSRAYEYVHKNNRFLHWSADDIGEQTYAEPFQALVLDTEAKAAKQEFEAWLNKKSWYRERCIPWRRGFLFGGKPGTGKTSLARAMAQQADMPVFLYDLATLTNQEFVREWQQMQEQVPCMALLEDIDACFNGRTSVSAVEDALTFDCLLNAIGGIQSADGVFLIVTSNHPETLDPALVRPGRLDRTFTFGKPPDQNREAILKRICGHANDLEDTEDMTVAEVTEFAVSKALAAVWDKEPVTCS